MKGLIRKDIYVITKQLKLYLVMVVIFSLTRSMYIFAILYCSMLPYTAMAYDERSKWHELATMMPYTISDIVLSKYVLGWISIGLSTCIAFALNFMMSRFDSQAGVPPSMCLTAFTFAALLIAITYPLMFRFGVEKGRIGLMVLSIFAIIASASLTNTVFAAGSTALPAVQFAITFGLSIAAAVSTVISIILSIKFFTIV